MMPDNLEDRLSAWLDGALDPAEAAAFERDMAADADLARRAAQWRANDLRMSAALTGSAERPLPAATLALLTGPAPAANDNPRWQMGPRWRIGSLAGLGAVAATLLVVFVQRPATPDAFSLALDRTPSLADAALPDGRHIVPALTTQAHDGRWCREYRDGGAIALACRGANGQWHDEARGAGTAPEASGEIAVASGANDSALDPAFRRLGTGDAVDAATEARLIAGHWAR